MSEVHPSHTQSANLEEVLLKLSENSDFDISNFRSPSLSNIGSLQNINNKKDKELVRSNFIALISPFWPELTACLMGYLALLTFSLLKGGKGFQR